MASCCCHAGLATAAHTHSQASCWLQQVKRGHHHQSLESEWASASLCNDCIISLRAA